MCEEEARVVEMRPVEKAAPALSAAVGDSVSCVLGVDAAVLGDGGVSYGVMGRHVSACDMLVGGDMELCGFDTVLSSAVDGGLCDLDRVSGVGDMEVSCLDTVVSGAISGGLCDLDSVSGGGDTGVNRVNTVVSDDLDNVSGGDIVVRVSDMSLSGGCDAVVFGVDGSVCGDNSVVTAGEFDVCVCGSLVSDEAGDVVSVVACGDDPLLSDAVRVGGRLSVVGDTLVCDSGIARSGIGDTEVMVVPGVAEPVWVDELFCADGSLRPEPPPMNALWLRRGPPCY